MTKIDDPMPEVALETIRRHKQKNRDRNRQKSPYELWDDDDERKCKNHFHYTCSNCDDYTPCILTYDGHTKQQYCDNCGEVFEFYISPPSWFPSFTAFRKFQQD